MLPESGPSIHGNVSKACEHKTSIYPSTTDAWRQILDTTTRALIQTEKINEYLNNPVFLLPKDYWNARYDLHYDPTANLSGKRQIKSTVIRCVFIPFLVVLLLVFH